MTQDTYTGHCRRSGSCNPGHCDYPECCTAPDTELPELPEPAGMTDRERGYSIRPYAADQVRQIQREAFEAGRKAADDDLEWLRQNLFVRSWCGTIGRPCTWSIRGDYRHTTQKMLGNSLREAIDAARKAKP